MNGRWFEAFDFRLDTMLSLCLAFTQSFRFFFVALRALPILGISGRGTAAKCCSHSFAHFYRLLDFNGFSIWTSTRFKFNTIIYSTQRFRQCVWSWSITLHKLNECLSLCDTQAEMEIAWDSAEFTRCSRCDWRNFFFDKRKTKTATENEKNESKT